MLYAGTCILFFTDGVQFKVLCSYNANFKEEISLQEGEIVTGMRKDRNGWMYGRKNRTNEIGHFPAVHVEKATLVRKIPVHDLLIISCYVIPF